MSRERSGTASASASHPPRSTSRTTPRTSHSQPAARPTLIDDDSHTICEFLSTLVHSRSAQGSALPPGVRSLHIVSHVPSSAQDQSFPAIRTSLTFALPASLRQHDNNLWRTLLSSGAVLWGLPYRLRPKATVLKQLDRWVRRTDVGDNRCTGEAAGQGMVWQPDGMHITGLSGDRQSVFRVPLAETAFTPSQPHEVFTHVVPEILVPDSTSPIGKGVDGKEAHLVGLDWQPYALRPTVALVWTSGIEVWQPMLSNADAPS
mmetsp:Transcript_13709/g.39503  ORF Transcript_13709/g.39503 Transcript_13709/m.39503 type:complete len:261 (+) Transcript_13709:111-893(+)